MFEMLCIKSYLQSPGFLQGFFYSAITNLTSVGVMFFRVNIYSHTHLGGDDGFYLWDCAASGDAVSGG